MSTNRSTKLIGVRVPTALYDRFVESLVDEGITPQDKLREWINVWTQGGSLGGQHGQRTASSMTIVGWLEKHQLDREQFSLEHRPAEFMYLVGDLSWLFREERKKEYLTIVGNNEVNKNQEYLSLWLWSFVWTWLTLVWLDVPLPETDLITRWRAGAVAAEVAVEMLMGQGYDDRCALMLKTYIDDDKTNW